MTNYEELLDFMFLHGGKLFQVDNRLGVRTIDELIERQGELMTQPNWDKRSARRLRRALEAHLGA